MFGKRRVRVELSEEKIQDVEDSIKIDSDGMILPFRKVEFPTVTELAAKLEVDYKK